MERPTTSTAAALADLASVGVIATDGDWRIVAANAAVDRLTGYTPADLVGTSMGALMTPAGRVLHQARFAGQVVADGTVEELAMDIVGRDGQRTPMLLSTTTVSDDRLGTARYVTTFTRAIHRRAYERELLSARRRAEISERSVRHLHAATRQLAGAQTARDVSWLVVHHLTAMGFNAPTVHLEAADIAVAVARSAAEGRHHVTLEGSDGPVGSISVAVDPRSTDADALTRLAVADVEADTEDRDAILDAVAAAAAQALTRIRLHDQLREQAESDPLTGLANRRHFGDTLARMLEERRRTRRPLTVYSLDLNGFKQVNDAHGHAAGDRILTDVANALRATLRPYDLIGRLGGDEFVVVTRDLRSAVAVAALGDRLASALQFRVDDRVVDVSIGVVHLADGERPDVTCDELLRAADEAMYRHKAQTDPAPARRADLM